MLIINLETGETYEVDPYRIMELGMEDGFDYVSNITDAQWIEALQNAINRKD